ncbi:MAG: glycosyltransferase [Prevotellaceae bacterium]|jgi:cellulose synthase/poly-beta-1,6-N-acetylglucosamine synthase-like glycosyltransferase|nr:glycosyltransferase [Prevotellaceae bacterium]
MISLIIASYKNIPGLELIFEALKRQTFQDFEVIVAEDDNAAETVLFLERCRKECRFPIAHVSHEDCGFRKNKIMNEAVKISKGEKLVFLDGDCIPHRKFLEMYDLNIKKGAYYYGRRVLMSEKMTNKLLATKNLKLISLINLLLSGSSEIAQGIFFPYRPSISKKNREIWGSNWGVLKEYVIRINGYDEDYTSACCGEDNDIGWRLRGIGLKLISLKNKTIQYHLFHRSRYVENVAAEGLLKLNAKKLAGITFCVNGIDKKKLKIKN